MISFESKFNLYIFLAIFIALLMVVCICIQIIIIKKILRSDKEDLISSKKNKSELMMKNEVSPIIKESVIDIAIDKEEKTAADTPAIIESHAKEILELDHSKQNDISDDYPVYHFIAQNSKPIMVPKDKRKSSDDSQDYGKVEQNTQKRLNHFTEEQHLTSAVKEELDGEDTPLNKVNESFIDDAESSVQAMQPVIETVDQTVNLNKEIELAPSIGKAAVDLVLADDTQNEVHLSIEKMNENSVYDENLKQIEVSESESSHVLESMADDHQHKASIEKNINIEDTLMISIEKKALLSLDDANKDEENELDQVNLIDSNDHGIDENLEIKEVIHLERQAQHLDSDDSSKQEVDGASSSQVVLEEDELDDYSHLLIKPIPIHIKRNDSEEVKPVILAPEIHSEDALFESGSAVETKNIVESENLTVIKGLNHKIDFRYTTREYSDKFSYDKDIINVKKIDKDSSSKTVVHEMNAAVNRMTSLDTKKEFDFKKILDTYHKMSDMYK